MMGFKELVLSVCCLFGGSKETHRVEQEVAFFGQIAQDEAKVLAQARVEEQARIDRFHQEAASYDIKNENKESNDYSLAHNAIHASSVVAIGLLSYQVYKLRKQLKEIKKN